MSDKIEYIRPILNFSEEKSSVYGFNWIKLERILRKYGNYIKFSKITISKITMPKIIMPKITMPKITMLKITIPKIHIPDFWIFKNEDTIKYEQSWERYSW